MTGSPTRPAPPLAAGAFERTASDIDAALLQWLADPAHGRGHGHLAASLLGRLGASCREAGLEGLAIVLELLRDSLQLMAEFDGDDLAEAQDWITRWREPVAAGLSHPGAPAAVRAVSDFLRASPAPPAPEQLAQLEDLLRRSPRDGHAGRREAAAVPAAVPVTVPAAVPTAGGAAMSSVSVEDDDGASGPGPVPVRPVPADLLEPLTRQAGEALEGHGHLDEVWRAAQAGLEAWAAAQRRLEERLQSLEEALDRHVVHVQSRGVQPEGVPADSDPLELDRCHELQTLVRLAGDAAAQAQHHGQSARAAWQQGQPLLRSLGQALADQHRALLVQGHVPFADAADTLRRSLARAAAASGRPARLSIDGAQVRLDPQVLARLTALLSPWLASVASEGIEPARERAAAGKPVTAHVHLQVTADARHVTVACEDDGRPGPRPGETAPAWLAAVRAARGRCAWTRPEGGGRRLQLVLPASTRWLQALLVEAAGQVWALPGEAVVLALAAGQGRIGPGPVWHYSGREWPCHSLAAWLGLAVPPDEPAPKPAVLVQGCHGELALTVDRIIDSRELVLQPVEPLLQRLPGLAGAALQGDGGVTWVLDPAAMDPSPA